VRILYLTYDDLSRPFAWSVHVREIVNGLAARGHAVRLVAPRGVAPGVSVPCDAVGTSRGSHLVGSLFDFLRAGRAHRPDAVYVRGIHATPAPALAAELLGRPLVVEVNGLLERELSVRWRKAVARLAHRFVLSRAARVVTVSPLLRSALAAEYGFPEARIDVVPNGADTARFRPADRADARRRLGLPADRPIVLCVASFYPHHALDVLLAARERCGATLLLVGASGPVPEGVISTGPVPHERVPDYVAAADVCAFTHRPADPSLGCSPVKVYEYMAGGRAVAVATSMEETRRFVEEGGFGLAVPLDAERLAGVLTRLLADPAERERMGRRGRALAEAEYGWDRAAARVEDSIRRAVEGRV
jgi:glycosyltransferase involved in cell wall biosynthesis